MTGLTDVRDRTLTMLRALGVEPDVRQMRTVEKYARWVDQQVSEAHIDGRAMDREIAGGHEMVVTHDGDVAIYTCAASSTCSVRRAPVLSWSTGQKPKTPAVDRLVSRHVLTPWPGTIAAITQQLHTDPTRSAPHIAGALLVSPAVP